MLLLLVFYFLEWNPGLYGNLLFNCLRKYQTVFLSVGLLLHSHWQCIRVPISPQPHQQLLSDFSILVILLGTKWYLIVILICIFFMTNDVEHCFMCLFATCVSSLEKCLFRSFAHFKNWIGGGASSWQKSKTQRSPSSPQIHQKYICMWNNSYRTPTERWQKTSDLPKGKKLPTYLGRAKKKKEKSETKE